MSRFSSRSSCITTMLVRVASHRSALSFVSLDRPSSTTAQGGQAGSESSTRSTSATGMQRCSTRRMSSRASTFSAITSIPVKSEEVIARTTLIGSGVAWWLWRDTRCRGVQWTASNATDATRNHAPWRIKKGPGQGLTRCRPSGRAHAHPRAGSKVDPRIHVPRVDPEALLRRALASQVSVVTLDDGREDARERHWLVRPDPRE